ncbi:MAG: hypothetical protein GIX03_02075 [Candidatus Eremiobacteraeota bacterium]|nr:hypothetical protein [Candidatus Eremiobacteraeota bacterium]MBC5821019.1 hypothetical protein [Candidatus Eremiobacteraeota bacterium]
MKRVSHLAHESLENLERYKVVCGTTAALRREWEKAQRTNSEAGTTLVREVYVSLSRVERALLSDGECRTTTKA